GGGGLPGADSVGRRRNLPAGGEPAVGPDGGRRAEAPSGGGCERGCGYAGGSTPDGGAGRLGGVPGEGRLEEPADRPALPRGLVNPGTGAGPLTSGVRVRPGDPCRRAGRGGPPT